jgi:organic hydroperoxide reductase OsmC/OhrA
MSVAGELAGAGAPPGIVEVRCTIVMDEVEGQGHQIVGSRIEADVRGEGIDDGRLAEVIDRADEGCPFSSLLRRAGASVSVAAALV